MHGRPSNLPATHVTLSGVTRGSKFNSKFVGRNGILCSAGYRYGTGFGAAGFGAADLSTIALNEDDVSTMSAGATGHP